MSRSPWRDPRAVFGLAVVGGLCLLRLAAAFVSADPALPTDAPMLGPSWQHVVGTDQLGRDLLGRLVESTEAFFFPGLFACLVAAGIGVPVGALLGYWPRSPLTRALQATLTVVGAWPRLVLVVVVIAIFTASLSDPAAWAGARLYLLGGLVGLSFIPSVAHALGERVHHFQRENFVEAARAHGISDGRILGYHILWANCRDLVLRSTCTVFGTYLLVETSLSYLGHYGVPAPRPSWGNILADVRFSVVNSRRLLTPDSWTPGGLLEAVGRAIHDGGLLAVATPTLAIALSIGGLLALADHFASRDAA